MILDMLNESNLFGSFEPTQVEEPKEENLLEGVEAIALKEGEDPVSACYRITMENEQNWFNIMNTIAFSEMAYIDKHGVDNLEGMYEAVDFKQIKESIVTFIQIQWRKLKGVIEKAVANLSEMIHKDKAIITAYESKVKKDPSIDKKTKKVSRGRLVEGMNLESLSDLIKQVSDAAHDQFDDLWSFTNYYDRALCKDKMAAYANKDFEYKEITAKHIKEGIVSKEPAVISAKAAYTVVKAGNHANALKKVLKSEEGEFNKLLATFKKEKADNKKTTMYADAAQVVTLKSKYVKQVISKLNMAAKVCIQGANSDYAVHRAVLRSLIGTKAVEETPTNESVGLICDLI